MTEPKRNEYVYTEYALVNINIAVVSTIYTQLLHFIFIFYLDHSLCSIRAQINLEVHTKINRKTFFLFCNVACTSFFRQIN
jgi:hypothetical protein